MNGPKAEKWLPIEFEKAKLQPLGGPKQQAKSGPVPPKNMGSPVVVGFRPSPVRS